MPTVLEFPRAAVDLVAPYRWRTDDGYEVVESDRFHVHTPTGAVRAVCGCLDEACEAICALRVTGGQYAHPWIAYLRSA